MVEQPIYIKTCAWLATLLPAIIGAAISLKVSADSSSFWSRLFTFLMGVALANYAGGATTDYFHVDRTTMIDDAIIMAWGIFGMATATQVWTQFPALITGLREAVVGLIRR